ncbi:MAG: hypothetical protein KatS3mg060_2287 [Dehalococcoidia bacterium]|nr:MAG: hypothetical protein KatS3mg060_2287 [Dehalococcoidia bacterium]
MDVIDRVPQLGATAAYAKQAFRDRLIEHRQHILARGDDPPEIRGWRWTGAPTAGLPAGPRGRAAGQPAGVPGGS